MDRHELSARLRAVGRTKRDLALATAKNVATVYSWGDAEHPIPAYAMSLLDAWEKIAARDGQLAFCRQQIAKLERRAMCYEGE